MDIICLLSIAQASIAGVVVCGVFSWHTLPINSSHLMNENLQELCDVNMDHNNKEMLPASREISDFRPKGGTTHHWYCVPNTDLTASSF